MKQVYLLIIALLFPVSMWADDVTIPLYDTSKGGTDAADQIQISVLDEVGNVVYEDTVAGNCSFTLGSQVKGELTLLLETEDVVYKGTFYLE